jgi:hypothetical protein
MNENEIMNEHDGTAPQEVITRGTLTDLVMLRNDVQKLRIMERNRVAANVDTNVHQFYHDKFEQVEREVDADIRARMIDHPCAKWISAVKGLAEVSAAQIVSEIDITRCNTISALWRYAGYAVIDGKRERPTKGEKLHYNKRLKVAVYRATALQIRLGGPYATVYRAAKHTYMTTRGPESALDKEQQWTKAHCEYAARRKASKLMLAHLWQVWRQAANLPVTEPFIARSEGHDIIDPWDFLAHYVDAQNLGVSA